MTVDRRIEGRRESTQMQLHRSSLADPEPFWHAAARAIEWDRAPATVLDDTDAPFVRWFPDGRLNTCFNAVDRHVAAGRGDQLALVHDSPMTQRIERFTYGELLDHVALLAGALARAGVRAGHRVLIYMPMIPQAVFAMLACARVGAIHSVVFGGFAARELSLRIDHSRPKLILTASCGLEPGRTIPYKPLIDEALRLADHRPDRCVIWQRPELAAPLASGDATWDAFLDGAEPAGCTPVAATDPLYLLYTSGTTGKPKGIVRDNGGHAVALQWSMPNVFDTSPGAVFWAASDVGWVVGHSYIVYAPLLNGNTTVLFEGKPVGTPDAGAFWRVIAEHGVSTLLTAPTTIRAIRKADPDGELRAAHDISSLEALFLAGERTDPDTYAWLLDTLEVPVVDHWWQTETGWPMAAVCLGIERVAGKPGSCGLPVPGFDLQVLDEAGAPVASGTQGDIAVKLPLPPGSLPTLWQSDEGFVDCYLARYPGYYLTGDGGYFDEDGYLFVMGRVDDVINVAGHRLSTGSMEQLVAAHPDVAECAVVGIADPIKGQVPIALIVLKDGAIRRTEDICDEVADAVRSGIGAIASLREVAIVRSLPKTRSGKVLRKVIRRIADGQPYEIPSTLEDPDVLQQVAAILTPPLMPGAHARRNHRPVR